MFDHTNVDDDAYDEEIGRENDESESVEDPNPSNEERETVEELNPSNDEDEDNPTNVRVTRSGRISRPPAKLSLAQHHLHTQAHSEREEYSVGIARVIAMTMCHIKDMLLNPKSRSANDTSGVK